MEARRPSSTARPAGPKESAAKGAAKPRPAKPKVSPSSQKTPKVSLPRVGKVRSEYRASVGKRVGAAVIDMLIGGVLAGAFLVQFGPKFGAVVVALYMLLKDALPIPALEGRSIGKKVIDLHLENEATGDARVDPLSAVKRNLTLVVGLLLVPVVYGLSPALALLVAAVPPVVEIVFVLRDPNGIRLGDRLAGTKVLD